MIRTPLAVAALLAAGLAGACSDDDPKPDIADPTPSVSSTAPTEASTSPTTEPTQSADPVATVEAWVDARNEALATGDTARLRSATDPKCKSCMSLITSIEDVYEAGGSYDTQGWDVKSAKARQDAGTRPVVDAALVFAGGTTIDESGADPVEYGPENHIMLFKMHEEGGQFLIDFVGFVS